MLRKWGFALAAGVLVAGCGAVPAGDRSPAVPNSTTTQYSPGAPTTSSTAPETATPDTSPALSSQDAPSTTTPVVPSPPTQAADPAACGSGYYRNSSGNCVHDPSSNPSGATALCEDGSYSYSQHRSGTCSRHGGVRQWL
ncbi:DUF3761 domain-containing protein [Amycolatopsis benzoatilytica]|uniref:DUF3761 domain-containing protein n=1 Tax=Amycolatopsis benzoatilytica TaxID=346045 RepID=UPI0003795A5A|nr:DUF3761 domain-containing protein [Amycolatopsis benzoatilytica]